MENAKNKLTEILNYKIRINGIGTTICSMIYIYIAIFIFLLTWVKLIFSIPICIILLVSIIVYIKKKEEKLKEMKPMYMNVKVLLFIIFVIGILCFIFGWTGFAFQVGDWAKHNCVLADLTTHSYPVYYNNQGEVSMLTYYLGQYIVPSFIGKIFSSINVSFVLNGIWASIGLFLAILGILRITKSDTNKKQFIAVIITVFFSTCVPLSQFLGRIFINTRTVGTGHWFMLDNDYLLQYSANAILLRWVMPQCIIPWMIFPMLYEEPFDFKNYALLCVPILFYSSFSFVAIAIIILALLIVGIVKSENKLKSIKEIFSLSNIGICATLGIILLVYFAGNVLTDKPENLTFVSYPLSEILVYIIFIFSFLPYTFILFKFNKKNTFYWVATAILLILPFFRMGKYNDFCMRVSIIPLFTYMLLSIKLMNSDGTANEVQEVNSNTTELALYDSGNLTKYKHILLIPLIIGSISSSVELNYAIESIRTNYLLNGFSYSLELCANRKFMEISDEDVDMIYNYYSYDLEDNLFYKYLAREQYTPMQTVNDSIE